MHEKQLYKNDIRKVTKWNCYKK